jgi:AP-1-like transcription factor
MSSKGRDLYLSPDEQDLLVAALNSNQPGGDAKSLTYTPNTGTNPGSGHLDFEDDSPYLDFDADADFDDSNFDFDPNGRMIGDLPDDDHLHDKRKSLGDKEDDDEEGGGKRREGDDKVSKKPGRKPLTSEPTSVGLNTIYAIPFPLLTQARNERHKIVLLSVHSVSARRST